MRSTAITSAIAAMVLIFAGVIYFTGPEKFTFYVGDITPVVLSLLAAIAWSILAAKTPKTFNVDKKARMCIAGFLWLNFLGETSWVIYELFLNEANPLGSVADIFWHASYIFLIIGLILFIKTVFVPRKILVWFNVVFISLALTYLVNALVFTKFNSSSLIQTLYVVWDLIALGLVLIVLVPLVLSYNQFTRSWIIFLAGILGIVIFDMIFAGLTALGTYATGNYVDLIYFTAYTLLGFAANEKYRLIK